MMTRRRSWRCLSRRHFARISIIVMLGESSMNSGASDTALIRLPLKEGVSSAALSERVMTALKADDPSAAQQRVEFVGPQVGKDLVAPRRPGFFQDLFAGLWRRGVIQRLIPGEHGVARTGMERLVRGHDIAE